MKTLEFFVTKCEGEITSTSDEKALNVYNTEMGRYWKKEHELFNDAYPKQNKDDFFDIGDPVFDVEKRMKEEGYYKQSLYTYKPEDGENGHGFYETPFAKIETFILNERLSFENSDGVCLANHKIKITLK